MENNKDNLVVSNLATVNKELSDEANIANEIKKIIELDIKELDLFEAKISSLAVDVHTTNDLDSLQKIEDQFIEIKNNLIIIIKRLINQGVEDVLGKPSDSKLHKTVGDYIDDKRNDFFISQLTHNTEHIHDFIKKIIILEDTKNELEMNINHKKIKISEPSRTYEVEKGFIDKVDSEIARAKVKPAKEMFDKLVLDTFTYLTEESNIPFSEKEKYLLDKVDYVLKKSFELLGIESPNGFVKANLNIDNVISLSTTALMNNNFLRAAFQLSTLTYDNVNYINVETYKNKSIHHKEDYILFEAINENSIDLLEQTKQGIKIKPENKDITEQIFNKIDLIELTLKKKDQEAKEVNDAILKQRTISKILK